MTASSVRAAFDMWPQYDRRLREVIAAMSADQLAIRPAGGRAYWICDVLGEPGAETTPFAPNWESGWEDDLEHPRSARELADALDSTFRLLEQCLDRWSIDMLADRITRDYFGELQIHTRGSILQRLFSHDAYHCGELSQTLGMHGLPQIDLWRRD